MNHIKQIRVQNFQSHRDSTLELHEGVNVIVGVSDAGKSGLFRAVNWPITNQPQGEAFRSKWGGDTSVAITFDDGQTVTRSRGKKNAYELQPKKGKALPFEGFKNTIPSAVCEVVDMGTINLQTQHDAPFLLSASPPDVAKVLNKVANLTSIDTAISNIRKKALSVSREIGSVEDQIADLEKQEKSFSYLEDMEKDVKAWQKLCKERDKLKAETSELSTLITKIKESKEDIEEINHLLSGETLVQEAFSLSEKRESLLEKQRALFQIVREIQKQTVELKTFDSVSEIEEDVDEILEMIDELDKADEKVELLEKLVTEIKVQTVRLQSDVVVIKQLEADFERNFPKVCPLCGKE